MNVSAPISAPWAGRGIFWNSPYPAPPSIWPLRPWGVIPARIAKTLSFLVDDGCVLIVAAGDAKIDNPKYKAMFHTKAKMLTPEQAQELTGHAVGGVCPFANPEGVRTYLDVSLKRFDTVFPAAGSSNSAIELTCDELEQYSHSLGWIDVCKGWQENS